MVMCLSGLQTSAEESTLKWFKELQEAAYQCAQSFEDLNNTKDMQVCSSFCLAFLHLVTFED